MQFRKDRSLKDVISIVAGFTQPLSIAIIRHLLQRDALVIVPASNAETILYIKNEVSDISTGTLVTLVCDPLDFERSKEITDHIQSNYGRIDLVIVLSCTHYPALPLIELDYTSWDTMQCDSLCYGFMSARLILPLMKEHKRGTFIQVGSVINNAPSVSAPLGRIASLLQREISRQLEEEVHSNGVFYYHVFSDAVNDHIDREQEARYILRLFNEEGSSSEELFHPAFDSMRTEHTQ